MPIEEYIEKDLPFYHITNMHNKESILKNGLQQKRCNAICVVRSGKKIVWDNIIICNDYIVTKSPGPALKDLKDCLEGYTRQPISNVPILPY